MSANDNEKVLGFAIEFESPSRLRIQHNPNNTLFIIAFIIVFGFVTLLALTKEKIYFIFYGLIFFVVFLQDLETLRPIRCVIDKQTGRFDYTRGNVLWIKYKNQAISGNIVDISQVEMKRYVGKGADSFQIVLLLKNRERLLLSNTSLDFEDCQKFSEKIRNFIGSDVPIKAIN
jgi:hypothetical protein